MDTSEQYIKMRLAAIPDLGVGKQPEELRLVSPSDWIDTRGNFYTHTDEEPHYCQLERQDQLQEMVSDRPHHPSDLAYTFGFFLNPIKGIESTP